ncbi:hypothetical protein CMI45_00550 [Candidatus Pacearchaeota archaeon]|nr:hypothetical protein [Candidatus Pacearchaeota archaeon]
MKKERSLVLLFLLGFVVFVVSSLNVGFVLGQELVEECYVGIDIGETLINNESIVFGLEGKEDLFGDYRGLVNVYDEEIPGNYILNVYNYSGEIIERYALYTSLLVIVENVGIQVLDSGTIRAIVPYFDNIGSVKIEFNGTETDLGIDSGALVCQRTCLIEGERGRYDAEDRCCLGFITADQDDGSFVCSVCGDSVCQNYEDEYSCFGDCSEGIECAEGLTKTEYGCIDLVAEEEEDREGFFNVLKETGKYVKGERDKPNVFEIIWRWLFG